MVLTISEVKTYHEQKNEGAATLELDEKKPNIQEISEKKKVPEPIMPLNPVCSYMS